MIVAHSLVDSQNFDDDHFDDEKEFQLLLPEEEKILEEFFNHFGGINE